MTLNISFVKFEYKYSKNAEFFDDFETVEKIAKKLLNKKLQAKKCQNLEFDDEDMPSL
jgi:hypothetical protein